MRAGRGGTKVGRGAAAVEMALTLPLILMLLTGLWESGRAIEVQRALADSAREAARLASTGQYSNAQVRQVAVGRLRAALNDTAGTLTRNVTVTVDDLNAAGTDVAAATSQDLLSVTVSVPFADVRWVNLSLLLGNNAVLSSQVIWPSMKDAAYPTTTPPPPQG